MIVVLVFSKDLHGKLQSVLDTGITFLQSVSENYMLTAECFTEFEKNNVYHLALSVQHKSDVLILLGWF